MATIFFLSPRCSGCYFEDVVAATKRFAQQHGHTFALRQTTTGPNYRYLKEHNLEKLTQADFLYCEETGKVKLVNDAEDVDQEDLKELVT